MATKQFYAIGDFRYANRMLRAGDGPIPMDAPTARLFQALGKISAEKPKQAPAPAAQDETTDEQLPKRAAAKRTTRRKK